MGARVLVGIGLVISLGSGRAMATWSDGADLIYNTAHTLDKGEFEVGIFAPLQVGVNDRLQLSLHPILLLILSPHAGLRWRFLPEGPFTAALNLEGTWSFLAPVNEAGLRVVDDAVCDGCGYPGSLSLTATASWEPVRGLMLSAGTGPRTDFLDIAPLTTTLATHASVLWLVGNEDLLMLHAHAQVHPWEASSLSDPIVQFTYGHAWGTLRLAVGIAVGEFDVVVEQGTVRALGGRKLVKVTYLGDVRHLSVFPVLDLFFRL